MMNRKDKTLLNFHVLTKITIETTPVVEMDHAVEGLVDLMEGNLFSKFVHEMYFYSD